jgi:hypothetical protein
MSDTFSNPLKAGIAQSLEQYQWFGSDCWTRADLIEIASTNAQPFWWPDLY